MTRRSYRRASPKLKWYIIGFLGILALLKFTPSVAYFCQPLLVTPELRETDVVVVLGGEIYEDGTLTEDSLRRTNHGIWLFQKGLASNIVFSGGAQVETAWSPAEAMSHVALEMGTDPTAIVVERHALSLPDHARLVQKLFEHHNWQDGLLVTSSLEGLRSYRVFQNQGVRIYPSPVPFYEHNKSSLVDRTGLLLTAFSEYFAIIYYWWHDWL